MPDIYKLQGTVEISTGKAEASLKRVEGSAVKTRDALGRFLPASRNAGNAIASGFDKGAQSASRLSSVVSSLQAKIGSLRGASIKFGSSGGGAGSGSSIGDIVGGNLISGAISSAISATGGAFKQAWQDGIAYNKMLENSSVRLDRFFSSAKQTGGFVTSVEKFAALSPIFEMDEAVTGAQRLLQMKYSAAEVIPELAKIGDMVGGVGGNAQTIDRVTLAMNQMVSTGKIQADEMGQLTEANIPAWELLAKAIGKTEAETRKLVEAGRIDAKLGVRGIIAAGGDMFKGQSDKAAQTLSGQESQAKSAYEARAGQATKRVAEQMKGVFAAVSKGLGGPEGEALAKQLDAEMGKLGDTILPVIQDAMSGKSLLATAGAVSRVGEATRETWNTPQQATDAFRRGDIKGGLIGNGPMITPGSPADKAIQYGKGKLAEWGILGADAAKSFGEGIKSQAPGAVAAGVGLGTAAKDGTKDSLQQHSPSKVMIDLGSTAAQSFVDAFSGTMEAGKGKISKSPIDVEKMRAAMIADLEKLREDPRIKAMLDTIAKAEGTGASYNMQFGGGKFSDMSDHPNEAITRKMGGKSITSTAAGRYQFLNRTWEGLEKQLGLPDFGAKSQDLAAIQLMKSRGMIDPILKGDPGTAFTKGNREWASLPGSPYGQPTKPAETLTTAYNAALEKYNATAAATAPVVNSLSTALDTAKQKLLEFGAGIINWTGIAATAPAKPIIAQRPGDGAQAKPFVGQIDGGNIGAIQIKSGAEKLTLSADAESASKSLSGLTVSAASVAKPATEATKAIATTSQAATDSTFKVGDYAKAIMDSGSAAKEAIDHFARFKDTFADGIDDMLENGFSKDGLKNMGKSLLKDLSSGLISQATGGKANSVGSLLSGALFGGLGKSGAGSVAANLPGGFAGGANPASGIGGGGSAVGNIASQAKDSLLSGGIGKLPGIGKVGGFLKGLPGIGGALGKIGGLFGGGAAGAAGAAAGAGGAMGKVAGALGFAGPWGMVAGIGLQFAAPLLSKLFGGDPYKDYKKLVKGEYGISISNQMAGKIMQLGQSKFGDEWKKRKIETVKLPEVRDMLSEYAGAFQKGGNNKLFDSRMYSDQFSAVNQIKVKMFNGGIVPGPTRGYDHVPVLMDGGERVISNADQRRMRGGGGGQSDSEMRSLMQGILDHLSRLKQADVGAIYEMGAKARPGVAARDVERSLQGDHEFRKKVRDGVTGR
jgi:tape measure domain-containing protein